MGRLAVVGEMDEKRRWGEGRGVRRYVQVSGLNHPSKSSVNAHKYLHEYKYLATQRAIARYG
jgi:hypothetical protein